MNSSPVASFTHFFFGFVLFISISFGLTIAVQNIIASQEAEKQQAAAAAALVGDGGL